MSLAKFKIMKGRFIDSLKCSLAGLRDLFFTRNCAVCGGTLEADERLLCGKCLGDIPLTYFWNYSENAAMETLGGHSGCHVHNAAALFFYRHESPYCEIVRQFKYGRQETLGLWAARLLGSYLACGGLYGDVQAVVPVPLHWRKRWRRGFNQAEIIARGVAEKLGDRGVAISAGDSDDGGATAKGTRGGFLVEPNLLRRRRYTSTQTRRGASSRRQNVHGVFALNPRATARLKKAGVRHILLVDDVMTTGATLAECIRLLQDHFTVSVATLGFVE